MDRISDNFELRFISSDTAADGETDFKGETSTLTTEQRVEFLGAFAERMRMQYGDVSLEKPVVSIEEAKERLRQIKPQPLPKRRKRIVLDAWKWIGVREENETGGSRGRGSVEGKQICFPGQNWRCMLELELRVPADKKAEEFSFGEAAIFGWKEDGTVYCVSDRRETILSGRKNFSRITIEVDFVYRKWNLYLDDELLSDFIDFSKREETEVTRFSVKNSEIESLFSHVWGVGYYPNPDNRFEPFQIETFVEESFLPPIKIDGWNRAGYDDSRWQAASLPISHGGERHRNEDLYLRRTMDIDQIPACALLYLESLTPGGEVYVNGRLVCQVRDEVSHQVDVTDYLTEGENQLDVRVYSDVIKAENKMTHTHTDLYTGWFAGRMHLDLLPEIYIEDVFSWTKKISEKEAVQAAEVTVKTRKGTASAKTADHEIAVLMRPWYPEEGAVCAETKWTAATNPNRSERSCGELILTDPSLWSCKRPSLYEMRVELRNPAGEVVDDFVVTTGIRTVSQENGIFRINGKPELLRAPLLFGARPPLEKIAAWEKCPPEEFYVQEMLMVQRMNGNGFRMSVHDENMGGINDPRICELADQMGIMLVWQTTAWLRVTSAFNLDYEELVTCIRQVRNHPSIVIWQPMNHPSWKNWEMVMQVYRLMHEAISSVDQSRLISPAADSRRMRPRWDDGLTDFEGKKHETCDSIWTAERICRGNMDYILGYGNEWSALRQWPNVEEKNLPAYMESTAYIPSYLESRERAYFNFEHDEIAGQPNWNLYKGKPMYHVMSYEDSYDEGSIGRRLGVDEWLASQAWQAFGAYETICKCRWLDYDGLSWCNLRGGQNTATYQKSIVDYYGQAKLAYYAHRMAFQEVLACSGNVDVVYGPNDSIPVILLNLGEEKKVKLLVEVVSEAGTVVFTKTIEGIVLPEGRSKTEVGAVKLPKLENGIYSINYRVYTE